MPRQPEHPLHPTLTAWAEWMRAGAHDNQGWPGASCMSPDRLIGEIDTAGIAKARRKYRAPEPPDANGNPDMLRIPVQNQSTPTQPRTSGSRLPRLNPPPPREWLRITAAIKLLHRDRITRKPAEAVMCYYVRRDCPWSRDCERGCDLLLGALLVRES